MSGPEKYGIYYWCVKTDLSEDGEIYVHADSVRVNENGDVLFLQESGIINLSLANGTWRALFAASVFDGSAVAVMHWKGEKA